MGDLIVIFYTIYMIYTIYMLYTVYMIFLDRKFVKNLTQLVFKKFCDSDDHDQIFKRDFDFFFSDGYDEPSNRVGFFTYKGSFHRFYGSIRGFHDCHENLFRIHSNKGNFTIDFKNGRLWQKSSDWNIDQIPANAKRFNPSDFIRKMQMDS